MEEEEKKEKDFVIRDRRFSAESEEAHTENKSVEEERPPEEKFEKKPSAGEKERKPVYPEINFINFIASLGSSVLFHFGEFPDPITNKAQRDLAAAKQTIDLIALIQEKTKGNLNDDEKQLIESMLFELRMQYVKEKEKDDQ